MKTRGLRARAALFTLLFAAGVSSATSCASTRTDRGTVTCTAPTATCSAGGSAYCEDPTYQRGSVCGQSDGGTMCREACVQIGGVVATCSGGVATCANGRAPSCAFVQSPSAVDVCASE